jgi:hypothetical protein
MSPISTWSLTTPSGLTIVLSPDEYRLALLGLVDFEGDWDTLHVATTLVADGEAKATLLREKLAPVADALPAMLADGVDIFQLWTARQWFASQMCQPAPVVTDSRDRGTSQEDA